MQICAAVHATQAPEEDAPPTHTHTHTETHTHTRYTGLHVPFLHAPALKQRFGGTLQLVKLASPRTVQLPLLHQYVLQRSAPTVRGVMHTRERYIAKLFGMCTGLSKCSECCAAATRQIKRA